MKKTQWKCGLARRRQVNRLRRQAPVRTVVVDGAEYVVKVLECPSPMDCTPLVERTSRWPGSGKVGRT